MGKKVIVFGAGIAGISVGIALREKGFEVDLLEKKPQIGGLCAGVSFGENIYEHGPHIFHTPDTEVLEFVKQIAGKDMLLYERTILIKFMGRFYRFPLTFSDMVENLSIATLCRAGVSYAWHAMLGLFRSANKDANSEHVLRRYYGDVIYRIFFKDYIIRVWGIEPKQMSPSFARERIPKMDLLEWFARLRKKFARTKRVHTQNYVEKVEGDLFTTRLGFSLISRNMAEHFEKLGGRIFTGVDIKELCLDGTGACEKVTAVQNGKEIVFVANTIVSTIPLQDLTSILRPLLPAEVLKSARKLRYRGLIFVGLLVSRRPVLPASFVYYRDKSFNRISDMSYFKIEVTPPTHTLLIAEITSDPSSNSWHNDEEHAKLVEKELIEEGLLTTSEVIERHVFKAEHAYPIYDLGFEEHLSRTFDHLQKIKGLHSIGRQGRFSYSNSHIAVRMGLDTARKIASNLDQT